MSERHADALAADVLVIGAGPAGLASAYYLEKAGISYVAVDRADRVASTWAELYPTLRLNTASFVSHLPGQRLPLRYGIYATGRQLYQYLEQYARRHRFNILLGVEVRRVAPEGDCWRAETSIGSARYKAVIAASGRFNNPYIPPIEGLERFGGRVLHARDYHGPAGYEGRRILVAGGGPSGADIAVEVSESARLPVLLSVRSDIVIARRYPYGLPDTVWQLMARLLPRAWRRPFINRVGYQGYRDARHLGMTLAPNRTDRRGTSAPVRGRELIDAIRAGRVKPVAGLARVDGGCAELMDGSRHEVDVIILSTGYRPAIAYLDIVYETDQDGWPRRISDDIEGGSTQVLGHPGLHLVGRYYRGLGPLYNIRNEARTAVEEIRARLAHLTPQSPLRGERGSGAP